MLISSVLLCLMVFLLLCFYICCCCIYLYKERLCQMFFDFMSDVWSSEYFLILQFDNMNFKLQLTVENCALPNIRSYLLQPIVCETAEKHQMKRQAKAELTVSYWVNTCSWAFYKHYNSLWLENFLHAYN